MFYRQAEFPAVCSHWPGHSGAAFFKNERLFGLAELLT
jgi:hypothetical protein